jgi:hypothetical protein
MEAIIKDRENTKEFTKLDVSVSTAELEKVLESRDFSALVLKLRSLQFSTDKIELISSFLIGKCLATYMDKMKINKKEAAKQFALNYWVALRNLKIFRLISEFPRIIDLGFKKTEILLYLTTFNMVCKQEVVYAYLKQDSR